jgi:hypothetical protein
MRYLPYTCDPESRDPLIESLRREYPYLEWHRIGEHTIQGTGGVSIAISQDGNGWSGNAGNGVTCHKGSPNEVVTHLLMILLPKMQRLIEAAAPRIKARLRESGLAKLTEEEKIALEVK